MVTFQLGVKRGRSGLEGGEVGGEEEGRQAGAREGASKGKTNTIGPERASCGTL